MANFNTTTKIFVEEISGTEVSTTAGTLSKQVNDYLETIDDAKLVSLTTSFQPTYTDGAMKLAIVVVTKD